MPEVPTIAEVGVPDYEALQWFGLMARRRHATRDPQPAAEADRRDAPEMQARLKTEGADAVVNTPSNSRS